MDFVKISFFIALSFLFQTSIVAQDWTSYQSQQQINDLVDTGDELLMATDAGLVVLNKSTLEKTIFNKSNSNLTNNHIQSISQAPDGTTWIGVYDVLLLRFDGTDFEDPTMADSDVIDDNTELYDFKIAPNGDFWIGTNDGIFHRQGQDWTHYDQDDLGSSLFHIWDMEINAAGEVFVASIDLHKFANGVWSNLTEGADLQNYNSADLFTSSTGDLYMAGHLDQISRYDGAQWESSAIDFNGSQVLKFTEDVDGNVYFNSQRNGIYRLENDAWVQQVDPQATIFSNVTDYFHIDDQNNRWMNRNIHLSVNQGGSIQTVLISDHTLESVGTRNINKGANGKMYFTTGSEENFSVLDTDGNWSFLPKPSMAIPFALFNDILALADDNIWLISSDGFYHYDGSDWELYSTLTGKGLDIDSQGRIYILSSNKVSILDNGTISEYNSGNSDITSLDLSGHGIDADDNLWIATTDWDVDNVIQKLSSAGVWTSYSAVDHPAFVRPVGDFHFDSAGNVWIAEGSGPGAIKFDGLEFSNPFIGNIGQMANYDINSIESDATGKLYFGHSFGVTTLLDGVWGDLLVEDLPQFDVSPSAMVQFDDAGTLWWGSNIYGVFSNSPIITSTTNAVLKQNASILIYPNPASMYATLDFATSKNTAVKLLIYNSLGQLVSSSDLGMFSEGNSQYTIDLSRFSKGVYKIQLQLGNENSTQTLIVQ